ncbi:MAG: glycosyltransferase family 2 protein [Clostridia bacterium]
MLDLISVIVPVYKVEKYLNKCVQSIVDQTYKNIEIILVDDGSPDNCPGICDEWAKKDDRIKVIHKENGGVSKARNEGLENINGDWIMFVDSDDYLELDILEKLYVELEVNKAENYLYQFNFCKLKDDVLIKEKNIYIDKINKEEFLSCAITKIQGEYELGNMYRAVWGKLFKANIISENLIRFDIEQSIAEDALFLFKYLIFIEQIKVINYHGYIYRVLDTSIVHKYKKDLQEQLYNYLIKNQLLIKENNLDKSKIIKTSMCSFVYISILALAQNEIKGKEVKVINRNNILSQTNSWLILNKKVIKNKVYRNRMGLSKYIKIGHTLLTDKLLVYIIILYIQVKNYNK